MEPPDEARLPAWAQRYEEKVRPADESVAAIQSGDHIFIGSGAAEPQTLVEALVKRASAVFGTEIVHIMTLGIAPYTEPKWGENFLHNALFIGPNVREDDGGCGELPAAREVRAPAANRSGLTAPRFPPPHRRRFLAVRFFGRAFRSTW